jgi:chromate transporter
VLSLDIPGGAFHRGAARQQGAQRRAFGVILNLAIWFALHTVFRETIPVQSYGLAFERPVLASVDPWALALCVAAIIAIFRFKVGMITTLLACCGAGIILHLTGLLAG